MIIVTTEPQNRLVIALMGGMLTVDEVWRFSEDEQAAARAMGAGSGEYVLLIETVGNLVQTQEVMAAFAELMLHSPLKAAKIATVRDGVLTRMQSRRLSKVRDHSEVFDNVADARAWLLGKPRAGHDAPSNEAMA